MILQKAFRPSTIRIGLESEDKDELFEELVDILARSYPQDKAFPREAVLQGIQQREKKMSTGIAKGVAVPHATISGLDGLHGVLGISRKGIDYEALDGEPVYLVFLLVSPPGDAELHLQALRQIALILQDHDLMTALLNSQSSEKAYEILTTCDILQFE